MGFASPSLTRQKKENTQGRFVDVPPGWMVRKAWLDFQALPHRAVLVLRRIAAATRALPNNPTPVVPVL
jgi:hypothetical protein